MAPKKAESKEIKEEKKELPQVKVLPGSIGEIDILIKAKVPYLYVVTHDENRFIKDLFHFVAEERKRDVYTWSAYQGLIKYDGKATKIDTKRATGEFAETWNPQKALAKIEELKYDADKASGAIFVMKDFHTVLAQPNTRQMRDIYDLLINQAKTIICVGGQLAHGPGASKSGMEPSLEKQMAIVRYSLPTRPDIEKFARDKAGEINGDRMKKEYTDEEFFHISRALQGLTYTEIENALSISLAEKRGLDPDRLMVEKKQIIMRSDILEYIESSATLNNLGGMDEAKKYFRDHNNSHSEEAEAFGVEPLKGVLLTGIPGTGKSHLAKSLGNAWKVPTLRLDVGKVMTGLVGGSEEKMRAVVNQATAVAPCITAETKILLANGTEITAEDLYKVSQLVGEDSIKLMALDPDTNLLEEMVMHTMIRRELEEHIILELVTENGTIRVTENHKLLTKDGWVRAENLKPGDEIIELVDLQKDTLTHLTSMISSKNDQMPSMSQ